MVPSRELALQIGSVVEQLWPWHGTRRVCVLSGSVSAEAQYAQLQTAVTQRGRKCPGLRPLMRPPASLQKPASSLGLPRGPERRAHPPLGYRSEAAAAAFWLCLPEATDHHRPWSHLQATPIIISTPKPLLTLVRHLGGTDRLHSRRALGQNGAELTKLAAGLQARRLGPRPCPRPHP